MTRLAGFTIRLYIGLLRLYPPQFRAAFSDEMHTVFTLAVGETDDTVSLFGLLVREVRDLPLSALREHLRERRQVQLSDFAYQEGHLLHRLYSPRRFHFCAVTLLALAALYSFSAVTAYFVFDLQTNSLWKADQWWYAVGNQPGYIGNVVPIACAGLLLWLFSPVWIVVAGSLLALMLWRHWKQLVRGQRWLGLAALIASVAMFVSMGSPIGYMAALWFYD